MKKWNTPLQVPLDSAYRTVVGRFYPKSITGEVRYVFLNSEKLPFMLSMKHASLVYDKSLKKWTIEDLKSQNGVFINKRKIRASKPETLRNKDSICFGSNVPKNELKYTFHQKDGKAILERSPESYMTTSPSPHRHPSTPALKSSPSSLTSKGVRGSGSESDVTPPLIRPTRTINQQQHPGARKRLKLDPLENNRSLTPTPPLPEDSPTSPVTTSNVSVTATVSIETQASCLPNSTKFQVKVCSNSSVPSVQTQAPPCPVGLSSSGTVSSERLKPGVIAVSVDVSSPVPSTSTKEPVEVDTMFVDGVLSKSDDALLDETVLCGEDESSPVQQSQDLPGSSHSVLSTASTKSVKMDDLFVDDILSKSEDNLLDETVLCEDNSSQARQPHHSNNSTITSSATTLPQVQSSEMDDQFVDNILSQSLLGESEADSSEIKQSQSSVSTVVSSLSSSQAISSTPIPVPLEGECQSTLNISSPQVVPFQPIPTSVISSSPICVVPTSSVLDSPVRPVTHGTSASRIVSIPLCSSSPSSSSKARTPSVPPSPVKLTVASDAKKPSPLLNPGVGPASSPSVKPSPALSVASTKSIEVDDLFDDIVSKTGENLLDEAIFSDTTQSDATTSAVAQGRMDGATIQVLAAQEKMEEEKHKLLSSIEALKSELAAKNDWITKREEDDKKKSEDGIVSSMTEEFTCVICQELFISAHTLPCAHSFCEYCIKQWMKSKQVCPICRKRVTSGPVYSLVLDNAIAKIEEKLSAEEKKDRDAAKEERKNPSGGATSHASTSSTGAAVTAMTTAPNTHDVIVIGSPPTTGTDSSELESTETSSDEDSDESSDAYFHGGHSGYGGYGRCYNCGQRGHWRPQCPYR